MKEETIKAYEIHNNIIKMLNDSNLSEKFVLCLCIQTLITIARHTDIKKEKFLQVVSSSWDHAIENEVKNGLD